MKDLLIALRSRAERYRIEQEIPPGGFVLFLDGVPFGWSIRPLATNYKTGVIAIGDHPSDELFAWGPAGGDARGWERRLDLHLSLNIGAVAPA